MSIIDNSIQLFTSNINSNIIYDVSTSNTFTLLSLFNSSNTYYINQIDLKQNLLNASTVLLGIGSNITELDYSKITINKPTNFQADWNTTIINKPDIYTKTEVNNINILANYYNITYINNNFYTKSSIDTALNGKEATLTFNTPLTRTINTIGINLNSYPTYTALAASNYVNTTTLNNYPTYTALAASNYVNTTTLNNYATYSALAASNYITNNTTGLINYPSFNILNSCNYITNSTLNSYATYTALNSSNYITNSTTGLINYYNTTQINNISNFNSNFTTQQSNILNTKIDTKENILTFNAPLTRTTNTIGINLNNYPTYTALAASNYITNSTTSLVNYPSFTILNTCNYITNSTLNSYATYTALAASNYITNSTTGLINYPSFTDLNTCNYLTAGNFYNKTESDGRFLKLDGTNSMTGPLQLPNVIRKDKLILWYNNINSYYAFGIAGNTLQYTSDNLHIFYTNSVETMRLDASGNLTTTGYVFAGGATSGLRINGNDYGNTIYQNAVTINGNAAHIGFTLRDNNLFNFWSLSSTGGGYTNIANRRTTC